MELAAIVEALSLDDDQQAVIEELFRSHSESHAQLAKEGLAWKAEVEEELKPLKEIWLSDNAPVAAQSEAEEKIDRIKLEARKREAMWADRLAALDAQFYDDVSLLLRAEQQPLWETYLRERRWRLVKEIGERVPWATARLTSVVEQMFGTDKELMGKLRPILEEHESVVAPVLDQMLAAAIKWERDKWRRVKRMQEFGRKVEGVSDLEKFAKLDRDRYAGDLVEIRREMAPQLTLRAINKGYVDQIAALLPPERVDSFMRAARLSSEQRGFQITGVHKAVQRLSASESISKDRKVMFGEAVVRLGEQLKPLDDEHFALSERDFQRLWNDPFNTELNHDLHRQKEALHERRQKVTGEAYQSLLSMLTPEELAIVSPPSKATTAPEEQATSLDGEAP